MDAFSQKATQASFSYVESNRHKNYMVVITIWFTISIYPYLKWRWIFYVLRICFLSSITVKNLPDFTVYLSNTAIF